MKKTLSLLSLALALALIFTACAPAAPTSDPAPSTTTASVPDTTPEPQEVTFVDFDGNEVTVMQNPKRVAIYDYAILDILHNVGFEKTGIEQLIVPSKDTLPTALDYYKNLGDDKVLTGGTLFYVDWDVLDLVQPDLVLLGARSFGSNAAGEDVEDRDALRAETQERYAETAFAKLSINARNSALLEDMERNVTALKAIFPDVADELDAQLAEIKSSIAAIAEKAQASGKRALFAMMMDQTSLSVFHPNSRFDMLYEEFGFAPVGGEMVEWTDQHGFDARAEYVLEANPDVVFLLDRSATVGSGAGAENFLNDSIIAKTEAAKNGNIFVLDGAAWYTMTGGFTATKAMIADLNQYIAKLG